LRMGSPQAVVAQRPEGRALRRARTGRADDGFQRHLRPLGLGRRHVVYIDKRSVVREFTVVKGCYNILYLS